MIFGNSGRNPSYWKGNSLEDKVREAIGPQVDEIAMVVKINQKTIPGAYLSQYKKWLQLGPSGIRAEAEAHLKNSKGKNHDFYESVIIAMEGASRFMERYAELAGKMYRETGKENLAQVARTCKSWLFRPLKPMKKPCSLPGSYMLSCRWKERFLLLSRTNGPVFVPLL